MSDVEERNQGIDDIEVRSRGGKAIVVTGTAIRYGARSRMLEGGFIERIMPSAPVEALNRDDVLALHEHDVRNLLGRTSSGTLRLFNSPTALRFEFDMPDTALGRDLANQLERRDINGMSFGFTTNPITVEWTVDENSVALRSVTKFTFFRDISTTASPAYAESTAVALRSLAETTGAEVRSVLDAAQRGELAALLRHVEGDTRSVEQPPPAAPRRRPAFLFG